MVVVNPGFVIGPGDVHRVSSWPIEEYLRGVVRFMVRGGLSYVDVRDVAAGHLLAEQRGVSGQRYILTNEEGNLSYPDFFARVGDVAGRRRRQVGAGRAAHAGPAAARALRLRLVPVDDNELRSGAYWWFYRADKARDAARLHHPAAGRDAGRHDRLASADGYRRH